VNTGHLTLLEIPLFSRFIYNTRSSSENDKVVKTRQGHA